VVVYYRQDVEGSHGTTLVSYEVIYSEVVGAQNLPPDAVAYAKTQAEQIFYDTEKHFL
jgi:hypothetical protein